MNYTILQWNCRSNKANFEELNLLINEKKPVVVCLQETFLKDSDKFSLECHSSCLKVALQILERKSYKNTKKSLYSQTFRF